MWYGGSIVGTYGEVYGLVVHVCVARPTTTKFQLRIHKHFQDFRLCSLWKSTIFKRIPMVDFRY